MAKDNKNHNNDTRGTMTREEGRRNGEGMGKRAGETSSTGGSKQGTSGTSHQGDTTSRRDDRRDDSSRS